MNSQTAQLSDWGLPPLIVAWFRKKGITSLFKWQTECLCQGDVLLGGNLVYSAPTSAGKTLVGDFLLLKRVLESNKKALVIEPFIALTREKATTLKSMLFTTKARVGAFAGGYYTPGGMSAVSVAVCTIEKANNFINKLINENKLSDLGIIVVDEIHYLGDERRGHQLELLLTKVIYYNSRLDLSKRIQIVGLSATIPNLKSIADWLHASFYVTEYRPVPLVEKVKIANKIYKVEDYLKDKSCEPIETLDPTAFGIEKDYDDLFCMCLQTIIDGYSTLVFCESKRECEIMATGLATQIRKTDGKFKKSEPDNSNISEILRRNLSVPKIVEVLNKLKKCPAGSDTELVRALRLGVAFHHAGLTSEEREIVEDGFKTGAVKVLMATSTLSSGVNLPARKVIIRSPMMISGNSGTFQREMLNPSTYRQMIGRAGRKNIDTCGESVLICRPENKDIAIELLKSSLGDIRSSLACRLLAAEGEPSGLKKAVLEVIANETAVTGQNVNQYLKSTFWLSLEHDGQGEIMKAINKTIRFLTDHKFIEELKPRTYKATRLGNAVLNSGLHPDESLELVHDLMKARKEFCLLNDLHIIYQVTPNDLARTVDLKDWQHYTKIWYELDDICRYVGARVGVDEIVLARRAQGYSSTLSEEHERVYRRFWVSLVINDLVKEIQLSEVCTKYRMTKATVQQVQRGVAQYAGVMSIFCNELGYDNIAALLTPLESRINFSCQRDLLDLVRLNVTRPIARALFNAGYKYILNVAKGDKLEIEFIIRQLQPFKKEQSFSEGDSPFMWVPELAKTMSTLEYATHIVDTARSIVEIELDIDLTSLDKRKDDDQGESSQSGLLEPSPIKRGRVENDSSAVSEQTDDFRGGDPAREMVRANNDVPNFIIHYVGRTKKEVNVYLDRWIRHKKISLNFKLEQQVNEPIGGRFKTTIKRRRRRSEDLPLCASTSKEDDVQPASDEELPPTQNLSQEGLPLQLDIDKTKHSVTRMYTCFGDDPTVYIIDSSQALRMIKEALHSKLNDLMNSSSSMSRLDPERKILYTQSIVLTYKVLYTAFNIDQITLNRAFEWQAFDVVWWMINNCPNRGLNNVNSSLSLVASTRWASRYHHFLHPSSPRKKGRKSKLVPPISNQDLGRSLEDFNRLRDVVKSGKTAILQPLINEILDELEQRNQIVAYREAEIGSRITMAQMMVNGIGLDTKAMRDELTLYEDISQQLTDIAQKYYAKSSISLTNIRQVAKVLYDDLDLKRHLLNHSTVSDISKDPTNSEILKILAEYHPFPRLVQDFRKIGKALEALQSVGTHARHNSELNMTRIVGQCDFWQLTGRVSMFDPDLFLINRNFTVTIPKHGQRPEEQIECAPRRCFIPVSGWNLIAADYSQLELRLLAHFSNDENLLEILNRSLDSDRTFDVFKTVAAKIYRKPANEISKENRQHAKQICYGIIYGMGNRSLANQLGVDVERAEEFRQDFFNAFPRIATFTEELLADCERDGYVESLLGRRRTIAGMKSENSSERSRAKRVAVNTRIQSSASDIIKLAMSIVNDEILNNFSRDVRLTLEMHDELIYEVNPDVEVAFARALKSAMENLASREQLRVNLLVNLKRGPNWSRLEDFITE